MLMPDSVRIFVCATPADMRRSFYGLCGMVREHLQRDPLEGSMFVFFNRRKDMVKILWYEENGFAIWMKRIDEGTFKVRFSEKQVPASAPLKVIDLAVLLKEVGR
jgi:transposase